MKTETCRKYLPRLLKYARQLAQIANAANDNAVTDAA